MADVDVVADAPCGERDRAQYKIDFIDPLFAVAIHIGVAEGLVKEHWFDQWRLPHGAECWDLFALIVALCAVVQSWVGYHRSIELKPLRDDVPSLRFELDVVLLLLYILMFLTYQRLPWFFSLLALVFFVYAWWDFHKTCEYSGQYFGSGRVPANLAVFLSICACLAFRRSCESHALKREVVSVSVMSFFLVLAIWAWAWSIWLPATHPAAAPTEAVLTALGLVGLILYRREKRRPHVSFSPLFGAVVACLGLVGLTGVVLGAVRS